jgi:hypothetical protein
LPFSYINMRNTGAKARDYDKLAEPADLRISAYAGAVRELCRTDSCSRALTGMSPDFYRKEAERLRRLAETQTDPEVVQRLRQMAAENDVLANAGNNSDKPGQPP